MVEKNQNEVEMRNLELNEQVQMTTYEGDNGDHDRLHSIRSNKVHPLKKASSQYLGNPQQPSV